MARQALSLLVFFVAATVQMVAADSCGKSMAVKCNKMSSPPSLNKDTMAQPILAVTGASKLDTKFMYQVPRKDAIKYCEDFYSTKSMKKKVLEVIPSVTPKVPSLVYLTASNQACQDYKKIKDSTTVQLAVQVVGEGMNTIINCPANEKDCYVYQVMMTSGGQSGRRLSSEDSSKDVFLQLTSRKLQQENCIPLNGYCDPAGTPCCPNPGGAPFHCDTEVADRPYCKLVCFPGDASVELEDGHLKTLDELRLSDRIKVVDRSGAVKVESAVMWLHRMPSKYGRYLRISAMDVKTNSTVQIRLSGNHFLPANSKEPSFATAAMVPARDVQPGWYVWSKASSDDALRPAIVTSATEEILRGVYSLLTDSGTVIVDGVAASNHADMLLADGSLLSETFVKKENIPALHHAFLTPMRMMAKLAGPRVMEAVASRFESGSPTVALGNYLTSVVAKKV